VAPNCALTLRRATAGVRASIPHSSTGRKEAISCPIVRPICATSSSSDRRGPARPRSSTRSRSRRTSSTATGITRAGTSIGDTEPEEKSRKQTLVGHVFSFHAENAPLTLNVIDTPGHADFLADAYASMHVADVAMLFVSADDDSLTYHARSLWNEAGELRRGTRRSS
jgi:hypothetical protein